MKWHFSHSKSEFSSIWQCILKKRMYNKVSSWQCKEFILLSLLPSPASATVRFSRAFTISRYYLRKVDYISKPEIKVIEAVRDVRPFVVVIGIRNLCFPFPYSFIYTVARRNPFMYAPTILSLAADYEHALESCCAETDISACLDEKVYKIFQYGWKLSNWSAT